jgi:hypothetical protein
MAREEMSADERTIPWKQIPRFPASKQRDPIQGEFFNTDSITTQAKQLTREGIGQNPLDANTGWPVRVRVFVSGATGALPPAVAGQYFGELRPHVEACFGATGREAAKRFDQPCRFLTIEDFNTSGLLGDVTATDPPTDGGTNHFFYFFRAEGKSGKSGSERGRWGVGKYVFPMASEVNSFFGLTVRNEGADRGPLLIGQAVLENHRLDRSYEPDGWWAEFDEHGVPVPITDPEILKRFRETWNVVRNREPGLSVIIPYVGEDLGPEHLTQAVLVDYYLAVLSGKFEVTISSPELDDDIVITAATLDEALGHLSDPHEREELRRKIEIARWHLGLQESQFVQAQRITSGTPRWEPDLIAEADRERIRQALETGQRVAVRVPVNVEPTDGNNPGEWSYFDVVFSPESGHSETPHFVREGLIVPEVSSGRLSNFRCLVTIEDGPLARMVGDAEGPAHTNWSPRTQKFTGKYRYGMNWLALIKRAPAEILKVVRQEDEEDDRRVLARFFPMPSPEPAPDEPGEPEPDPGPGPTPDRPPPPPPAKPAAYRIGQIDGGFSVHLTAAGSDTHQVSVRAAYDRRRGNAFNNWRPEDFTFSDPPIDVKVEGGYVLAAVRNELRVTVEDAGNFSLRARGFDTNRDLRVDVDVTREAER